MAATKRTKQQRELDLDEISRLHALGYSQHEMAARLGVSQGQISYDLKTIIARYHSGKTAAREVTIQQQLRALRHVCMEAMEAWERSKLDAEKKSVQHFKRIIQPTVDEHGNVTKAGETVERIREYEQTEGRLPENAYLQTIRQALADMAKLQDLYPDKKARLTLVGGYSDLTDNSAYERRGLDWIENRPSDQQLLDRKPTTSAENTPVAETGATGESSLQDVLPNGLRELPAEDTPPDESAEIEDYDNE